MKVIGVFTAASLLVAGGAAVSAEEVDLCADAARRYHAIYGEPPPPPGDVVTVLTYRYRFCPERVEIRPGTTVRWVNVERTSHSVWLKAQGQPESERVFLGEEWQFTFAHPGEFPYLCGPHWEKDGMTGTVVVVP